MEEFDNVKNPKHYLGRQGLEAIKVHQNFLTEEELRGYYKGNAMKYLLRERNKNGLEDLRKARKHLDWLIEIEKGLDTVVVEEKKYTMSVVIYFKNGNTAYFKDVKELVEDKHIVRFSYFGVSSQERKLANFYKDSIAGFAKTEEVSDDK